MVEPHGSENRDQTTSYGFLLPFEVGRIENCGKIEK